MEFKEFKEEFIHKVELFNKPSREELGLLKSTNTYPEIMLLIKTNFERYAMQSLEEKTMLKYRKEFAENGIYVNEDVKGGHLMISQPGYYQACNGAFVVMRSLGANVRITNSSFINTNGGFVSAAGECTIDATLWAMVHIDRACKCIAHDKVIVNAEGQSEVDAYDDSVIVANGSIKIRKFNESVTIKCPHPTEQIKDCISRTLAENIAWGLAFMQKHKTV